MTGFIASHFQRTVKSKPSEGDHAREILVHQTLVIRLQSLNVRHLGALRVKVKLIELLHPLHNLLVLWLGEVVVVATSVPRVARVKSDRPQASLRNGGSYFCHMVYQHVIEV